MMQDTMNINFWLSFCDSPQKYLQKIKKYTRN